MQIDSIFLNQYTYQNLFLVEKTVFIGVSDLLQLVLITVIGAYFGGRSMEKTSKIKTWREKRAERKAEKRLND